MSDFFYRDFEDRFRGSRALISARLVVYQPFLRPLADAFEMAAAKAFTVEQQTPFSAVN
jgi:O-antigen chain-terminating methyltransferase